MNTVRHAIHYEKPKHFIDDPFYWQTEQAYLLGQDSGADTYSSGFDWFTMTETGGGGSAVTSETPWYQSIFDFGKQALTVYQQNQAAKQMQQINAERMQRGLAPLSTAQYAATLPPSARVDVGLSPQTQQILTYTAIGLGAFLIYSMVGKKKRA